MDDKLRQRMESKTKKSIDKKISKELQNKTILVTGGAGSIGSHLVKEILDYPVKSIRVLDIDEHALFRLNRDVNNWPENSENNECIEDSSNSENIQLEQIRNKLEGLL